MKKLEDKEPRHDSSVMAFYQDDIYMKIAVLK